MRLACSPTPWLTHPAPGPASLFLFRHCTGSLVISNIGNACLEDNLTSLGDQLTAPSPRLSAQHMTLCPLLSSPRRLLGGYLHGHPEPSLGPGGGQTLSLAWVGSQASWRGSQEARTGVETTVVAHPVKTLGDTRLPILRASTLPSRLPQLSAPPGLSPIRNAHVT